MTPGEVAFVAGIFAGCADTLINYPPYGLHYRKQRGLSLNPRVNPHFYKPREVYRGVGPYAMIIPITCLTDGLTDWMCDSGWNRLAATLFSGSIAGIAISTPASNIIIHQQIAAERVARGRGTIADAGIEETVRRLYAKGGLYKFTTGMMPLIVREAAYATAVFWGKDEILKHVPSLGDGGAAVVAGVLSTVVSQPMDTLTTYMIKLKQRVSPFKAATMMYEEGGFGRFYYGVWLRGYAVIAGIFVMDKVSKWVKKNY